MGRKKRRGTPPIDRPDVKAAARPQTEGHPKVGWRLIQRGWGSESMSPEQALEFLVKWEKRGQMTWPEVTLAGRHGLGSETIPARIIRPTIPGWLKDSQDTLLAFRHHGNLPVVGIRVGDVFEVIWIETKFNELYSHDGKNRR